jgi:hypothetical protein
MRRRGSLLALGALLLAIPSGAQSGQERTPCEKLSPKHDLAPAKRVKLVELTDDDNDTALEGCVLPAGRLFVVASRYVGSKSAGDYELRQVEGHQVVVNIDFTTQSSRLHATDAFDLKTGRRYSIAARCHQTEPGSCGNGPNDETARRVRLNSSGQAAAVIATTGSDLVTVMGYSPRGNRKVLDTGTRDEIPASSLQVEGHVASWTHNGARRSARLPRVTDCQRLKAKDDLAPARRVKLVERENSDGGTDLIGCVLPDGKVGVVASSAKQVGLKRKYRILQVVGHEVLIRGDVINQYGHGVSTYVYDVKRAKSYNVAETCFDDQGMACEPQTHAEAAFVNAQGQAAAIVRAEGSGVVRVIGFKSTGASKVLDSGAPTEIPASSLSLEGHVVRWTHSGAPKSATLSG